MKQKSLVTAIVSWILVLWISKVFLTSLFYKFTGHPDAVHIFTTIGGWLSGFLGTTIGDAFSRYGAYGVGSFELLTALVLLSPPLFWLFQKAAGAQNLSSRARVHALGGIMASVVMAGAVFFHLASPLGVEVLHEGKGDGGSLFYAAVSILVSGIILFILNRKPGESALHP
ncbi:MAG: hypothetical protein DSZ00_08370 [Gammaproteobacteria bacterium]|nr:MAG: hypothetical protein DSZ00_08370 [Gammaproteobacteria bacterium]RTZ75872.1 MAG: hypothetical protein DSZ02_02400 [Gammaproteobacteria bacterium]RTZ79127.1 MAG: hypothetical protein DSZ01_04305 [Gammaproteobacteria bacterium]